MQNFENIINIASKYTILYVEDDEATTKSMSSILRTLFHKVYLAKDGIEGLSLFRTHQPDIIISDIAMPNMDGIEMAREIRELDVEVPIILFTAFSDKQYLLDSIFVGIDRYINKPLNQEEFFKALYQMVLKVENKKVALQYHNEKIAAKINEASIEMLKQTTQIYPNPTLIFKDKKLYFLNDAAMNLCQFNKDEDIYEAINKKIIQKEGFLPDMWSVNTQNFTQNKVLWMLQSGRRKIFLVNKKTLDDLEIYSLSDVTRIEYEKQKNQNLSSYLFDLLRFSKTKQAPITQKVQEPLKVSKNTPKAEEKEKSYDDIRLDAMHGYTHESAHEYLTHVGHEILEELDELEELENDLIEILEKLEESFDANSIHKYGIYLKNYSKTITSLVEFEDLAFSIDKIANFLQELANIDFEERKMLLLLKSIAEDLRYWRKTIFVTKEAKDIHYLDASLLSSCLQIENEYIHKNDQSDDDNDLELF